MLKSVTWDYRLYHNRLDLALEEIRKKYLGYNTPLAGLLPKIQDLPVAAQAERIAQLLMFRASRIDTFNIDETCTCAKWLKLATQFLLESVPEEDQTVGSLILLAKTEQSKLQYLDFENFSEEDTIAIQHVPDFLANNMEEIAWMLSGLSSAELKAFEGKI